jgi:hypothetical protein
MAGLRFTKLDIPEGGREWNRKTERILAGEMEHL